jgi:hypothetical protein
MKVQLDIIPDVNLDNVNEIGAVVVQQDYDYIWIETNLVGVSHQVWGKSGMRQNNLL